MQQPHYQDRRDAMSKCWNIFRSKKTAQEILRKIRDEKYRAVVQEYYVVLFGLKDQYCMALAETKADEIVSARHGWLTLQEETEQSFARLKKDVVA